MPDFKIIRNVSHSGRAGISEYYLPDTGFAKLADAADKTKSLAGKKNMRIFLELGGEWYAVNINPESAVCVCGKIFGFRERSPGEYSQEEGRYERVPYFGMDIGQEERTAREKILGGVTDIFSGDFSLAGIKAFYADGKETDEEDYFEAATLFGIVTLSAGICQRKDFPMKKVLALFFDESQNEEMFLKCPDLGKGDAGKYWLPFADKVISKTEKRKIEG